MTDSEILASCTHRLDSLEDRFRQLDRDVAGWKGSRDTSSTYLLATFASLFGIALVVIGWCVSTLIDLKTQAAIEDKDIREIVARHVNEDAARIGATPYAGLALPGPLQSTPAGPPPYTAPPLAPRHGEAGKEGPQ